MGPTQGLDFSNRGSMNNGTRKEVAESADQAQCADSKESAAQLGESIRAHYQTTGSFKPKDLYDLLGDPRQCVSSAADDGVTVFSICR